MNVMNGLRRRGREWWYRGQGEGLG